MPVLYLKIEIETKQFNRIIRFARANGGNLEIKITENFDTIIEKLYEPIEFTRLTHTDYYADLTVSKFFTKNNALIIIFDKIIDCNRTKPIPNEKR